MTLKASNTNTTLAPKSIYEVTGIQENEPVQEIGLSTKHERPLVMDKPKEVVYGPPLDNLRKLMTGDFEALPEDEGFAYTPDEPENDLSLTERRIQRLEEQMDGLLERLARFNFKASHKI